MNEELTMEVLEAMAKCNEISCEDCPANKTVCIRVRRLIEKLATALLEERAKPKVWDDAPELAKVALVGWYENNEQKQSLCRKCYTREPPKTRTRIMAEEIASAHISNKDDLIDIIEQTINAHMEELKGEA